MKSRLLWLCAAVGTLLVGFSVQAQLTDVTQTPNAANEGIKKSYTEQIGVGRGSASTAANSSACLIANDPARSIARGNQVFQRKFTFAQGFGPRTNDGIGDIETDDTLGAGLVDSCAGCHGRPRGGPGVGGNTFTRPDSRDAPHLFGVGLVEMIADEITHDLRAIRAAAVGQAVASGRSVTADLIGKGTYYGFITAHSDGSVDYANVEGVSMDLRVRPFLAQGGTVSLREFTATALNAELGLEAFDPDLIAAQTGVVTTPSGMVLDGTVDLVENSIAMSPTDDPDRDGVVNEVPLSILDHLEFFQLNSFKPGHYQETITSLLGRIEFHKMGCASCHTPNMRIDRDRRAVDAETSYDEQRGGPFNQLFAEVTLLSGGEFLVRDLFADFKRHDMGAGFWELHFDGSITMFFLTEPLWGIATTAPYGHDGRSINLREVILRHGGESKPSRDEFARAPAVKQERVIAFLNSLVLFGPPDTASNLDPGNPRQPDFPVFGHGSIDLAVLFTNACGVAGPE